MISLDLVKGVLDSVVTDCVVFLVSSGCDADAKFEKANQLFSLKLSDIFKAHDFLGKAGSTLFLSPSSTESLRAKKMSLLFVGIGDFNQVEIENLRKCRNAIGKAVKRLNALKISKATMMVDELSSLGMNLQKTVQDFMISAVQSDYSFMDYKGKKTDPAHQLKLMFCVDSKATFDLTATLFEAKLIGDAVNSTRHLADLPPNVASPGFIAEYAAQMAEKFSLTCKVFGEEKAKELGMGGFLAVGSGSDHEVQFVELCYKSSNPKAKTIALVGKGVAFDSGGISIKPWKAMTGMKYDMSGAAAVIGAMRIIAQQKPNVNVVGLAPLVENMPSGKCVRQDDILTHINGVTSEVQNTDAEGRLILADAIGYAEKYHSPDVIVDIATLTGACVVALGHFYTGLMSQDDALAESLNRAAQSSGDFVWRLPCSDLFDKAIDSSVADVANVGSPGYNAGTTTAAMFLKRFVSKARWAHLDIAGTSNDIPDDNYLGKGATGVGVRLLAEFAKHYC